MPPRRVGSEHVVELMMHKIETDEWPLNSQIPKQDDLASTFGVRPPVVRQAVRILSTNGVLETAPSRGTFVRAKSAVSAVLLDHLYNQAPTRTFGLRQALEAEATALAAAHRSEDHVTILRASLAMPPTQLCWTASFISASGRTVVTPDVFHTTIFVASGNPLLAELHQPAITALRRAESTSEPAEQRHAEHLEIFAAIERQDVEEARAAAARHANRDALAR